MAIDMQAPWHKDSWDAFLQNGLPSLLADCVSVAGYNVEKVDTYTGRLHLSVKGTRGLTDVVYENIPLCDDLGRFRVDGHTRIVVPKPTEVDLEKANILCVGEQALGVLATQIGDVPEGIEGTDAILACLPLAEWIHEFFVSEPTSQYLQMTNDVDMHTHLRRITLYTLLGEAIDDKYVVHPSQEGRVCLFATPEGPNISRIFEVALGATIRDGKLIVVDDTPAMALGSNASMIPFLEHDDTNRSLMGMNMVRQWVGVPNPKWPRDEVGVWHTYHSEYDGLKPETEPALVQTGCETDDAYFWKGYNLLTAFMAWDGDTYEDGIVISESAAKKMVQPQGVALGDKLSNRHGYKGVVTRILPDADMPHLPDGTPVELIVSVCSLPSRMNIGQLREAALGRVAKAEGKPVIVPPFAGPSTEEIRGRLKANGLSDDGMEQLTLKGIALPRRTTAGWVYWGRLSHMVKNKIHFAVHPQERGQFLGEMEFVALKEAGAVALVNEFFNTCSAEHLEADSLADRVSKGTVSPAGAPSARYGALATRLGCDGVVVSLGDKGVSFSAKQSGDFSLARSVAHPWLSGHQLSHIGQTDLPEGEAVQEANARLEQMVANGAPQVLIDRATDTLSERVQAFYDVLVTRRDLCFQARVLFSGRSVIVPNKHFKYDQVGVPEEMAWALFGPFVTRALGSDKDVKKRSKKAEQVLDEVMAKMWIVSTRAPAVSPTSFLAFHPVRVSGDAIQVPILSSKLMDADFDGDQMALLLPVTDEGQQAARDHLTIKAHLTRDPSLIRREKIHPMHDALFGLATLSMTDAGLKALEDIAGEPFKREGKFLDKKHFIALLENVMIKDGAEAVLDLSERLQRKGFEVAQQTGASMGAFLGGDLNLPNPPEGDDVDEWRSYVDELTAELSPFDDFNDDEFGVIAMLAECGARGNWTQLRHFVAPQGLVRTARGDLMPIRHCYRDGLTPQEIITRTVGARLGLANALAEMMEVNRDLSIQGAPSGYGVLSRARRSEKPGVVFARAAQKGEVDPLTDEYSRLFVGV